LSHYQKRLRGSLLNVNEAMIKLSLRLTLLYVKNEVKKRIFFFAIFRKENRENNVLSSLFLNVATSSKALMW
jgi:hypothetical protein